MTVRSKKTKPFSSIGIRVAKTALAVILVSATGLRAEDTGKEWVNRVLVQIGPGPDTLGRRIPGAWSGRDGSRIQVTDQEAFRGKKSLRIELRRASGGCGRITSLYFGDGEIEFSCRVFVPEGRSFQKPPAVAIWRGEGELIAQAKPVRQTGKWVSSALRMPRPSGNPLYFGVIASADEGKHPSFYVDDFLLCRAGGDLNALENAGFEEETGDRRGQLLADFDPDLINMWRASDLNKDGLLHRHGVRVASWGKVEYNACIDWDKRLDEFKTEAAKYDIDGNRAVCPDRTPFTNRMCHHSPVWHQYQKAGLTQLVADNDALGQDNLCCPTFKCSPACCFCRFCERDFRAHLSRRFSADELARLLPCPLEQFSIAEHVKSVRPDADDKNKTLLSDPLAREFMRAQYMYEKGFMRDIIESIDREACARDRCVPFFGNQGAPWGGSRMPPFSMVVSDIVDAQCLEVFLMNPYHNPHRHAWGSLQYRLMRGATRNRKPVWPLLPSGQLRRFPTGAEHHVAEALSNGAVPVLLWSPMSYPARHVYEAQRPYARLLHQNRALFLDRQPVARVGLVYSVPTCFWRNFNSYWIYWRCVSNHGRWIGGVARLLEDAHIPHEVIVLGHPDLLGDTEQLAAIEDFDVLVLTAVDCISDKHVEALRRFVERGGRLVIIGELGSRDEDYQPRNTSIAVEWIQRQTLRDRITRLPDSLIRDYMSIKSEQSLVDRAVEKLRDAIEPASGSGRWIRTDAPETLWMTLWKDERGRRLALHMVNYDVDVQGHKFRPVHDTRFTLRLPEHFEFNRLRLLVPGAPAAVLPFEREGDTVSFRVPSVRCYAIAVLTTDNELDVANRIAAAKRNLDRARVAWPEGKPAVKTALATLTEAERLYRSGDFIDAEEMAKAAVQATLAIHSTGEQNDLYQQTESP